MSVKTVVQGSDQILLKRLLIVIRYFIRCSAVKTYVVTDQNLSDILLNSAEYITKQSKNQTKLTNVDPPSEVVPDKTAKVLFTVGDQDLPEQSSVDTTVTKSFGQKLVLEPETGSSILCTDELTARNGVLQIPR